MDHFKPHNHHGFTLIELLLYVAISSTVLLAGSLFLATLLSSRIKNQTVAEIDQQGTQVMQLLTQSARNAETITAPAAGVTATSLTLDVVTVANDPTIFDLSAGVLRIKEGAAATIPLTNSRITASALSFQNVTRSGTPGSLRISFTLTYNNSTGRQEYTYSKTFVTTATLRHP